METTKFNSRLIDLHLTIFIYIYYFCMIVPYPCIWAYPFIRDLSVSKLPFSNSPPPYKCLRNIWMVSNYFPEWDRNNMMHILFCHILGRLRIEWWKKKLEGRMQFCKKIDAQLWQYGLLSLQAGGGGYKIGKNFA